MSTETPSAEDLPWAQRLVRLNAVIHASNLVLVECIAGHLPLLRHEQQPGVGLAVRKYVLMRRGLLASASRRSR